MLDEYYKIIKENNLDSLEYTISDYVHKGWIPVGSIIEGSHDEYGCPKSYAQAIYRIPKMIIKEYLSYLREKE